MKEVRLAGIIIFLALSLEIMKPVKALCAAWKEDKV